MIRNGKHRKISNQKVVKIPKAPRVYRRKRVLPKGLQNYNTILRTVKGLFPHSYRDSQRLASKIYRSGVDPNSIKDTIRAGSKIFGQRGEEGMKELAGLIKSEGKKVIRATKSAKPVIQETSLKGHLKSYTIKGDNKTDYISFLNNKSTDVKEIITKHEKPIKMRMTLTTQYYKGVGVDKVITFDYPGTKYTVITETSDLNDVYDVCKETITEKVETMTQNGSGWIFEGIVELRIHIDKFTPIIAKSYIPLPDKIRKKEAIINVQNKDNQCFKWSITSAVFPQKEHTYRVSKKLRSNTSKLNWAGLEFPVQVDKIGIFEKNNSRYAVNVYSYDKEVNILRNSDNDKREKTINLLLISNDETNHYCWIKSMSRLLNSQKYKNGHTRYHCERCLSSFKTEESLDKHSGYCKDHDAVRSVMPKKGAILKFMKWIQGMRVPFAVYGDFECLLKTIDTCPPNDLNSFTLKYQKHKPSGYCYIIICYDDNLMKPLLRRYTARSEDEDIGLKFITALEKDIRELYKTFNYNKKAVISVNDNTSYQEATKCHICDGELNGDKVLDHDHLTGKYRGAAHNDCNLNYKIPDHIPVIFHNLAGYDAHLFINNLGVTEGPIDCIPNNEEKYISFSKKIKVDEYTNKKGKKVTINRTLRFIDSYKFMPSGLESLVNNLPKDQYKNMKQFYDGQKLDLLLRKGVYPYDYMNSLEKLSETSLPPIKSFHNKLNNSDISDDDYKHAYKIWETFGMKSMREYHDLYMKSDVILLADVFESFRDVCMNNYQLDPCWHFTAPGLSWSALLKMTGIELDLISDVDQHQMIEKGTRGGISMIPHRYSKANNKYMKSYDKKKKSTYIVYLDANNLYGWAMSQKMPTGDLKWMSESELKNWRDIPSILEVDLEYPIELHDLHNEYPLAPEKLMIGKVEKLVSNLQNKTNYVIHHTTLKLYERLGLKITKIHRGIKFSESEWMKPYIKLNTNLRTAAKNDFEKDFFKLLNNSVFGKTLENVRKRQDIKLVTTPEQAAKLINKPNYKSRTIFSETLAACHMGKTEVVLNKPIYVGMSILDISKNLMYEFHYDYIKPKYGSKAKLLMTDTDSLIYEIETDDFYADIKDDIESRFDTSAYQADHKGIKLRVNKKVIGMMKDETAGRVIREFVGLRSKLYSYLMDDDDEEVKRCKGIKKSVVKKTITHQDYKDCLLNGSKPTRSMNVIRSHKHQIYTETVNKIALSRDDDKRIIQEDGIHTLAIGYRR